MLTKQSKINLDILKRFKEKADVLCDEKYSPLHQHKFSLTGKDNDGTFEWKISSEFPNDDLVKSFLMNMRMFIIKDSNFEFKKICSLFIEDDFEKDRVSQWLETYENLLDIETVKIKVGDKELTTRMVFHTILNEEHFHQEMEQKGMATIKASPFIEPMARIKFFEIVRSIRLIIGSFNKQIVDKYLEQHENQLITK